MTHPNAPKQQQSAPRAASANVADTVDETAITTSEVNAIVPGDLNTAMQLATWLAESVSLKPKFNGSRFDILAMILAGMEIGIPPMAALRGMYTVNGRPSIEAKTKMALCLKSGVALWFRKVEDSPEAVTWETLRRGEHASPVKGRFTIKDAEVAGLKGKSGPWQQYTQRMMSARALSFLIDDVYPDIVMGMGAADEEAAVSPGTFTPVGPVIDVPATPVATTVAPPASGKPATAKAPTTTATPETAAAPTSPPVTTSSSTPAAATTGPIDDDTMMEILERLSKLAEGGSDEELRAFYREAIAPAMTRVTDAQRATIGKNYSDARAEIAKRAKGAK